MCITAHAAQASIRQRGMSCAAAAAAAADQRVCRYPLCCPMNLLSGSRWLALQLRVCFVFQYSLGGAGCQAKHRRHPAVVSST
jgi:hypothetical protein